MSMKTIKRELLEQANENMSEENIDVEEYNKKKKMIREIKTITQLFKYLRDEEQWDLESTIMFSQRHNVKGVVDFQMLNTHCWST